ncbi:hypothetical protein BN971_04473 [Mycobacterium bohemicum DSM 44277]|nr:globin [Mycobacterium bohemicum]CPR13166.1 hypothetical protein BN971_04473 [Mycobacterium bohemicum DSM 44277]
MAPRETTSPVVVSLELYAEHVGDPIPIIYQRFYTAHPDAEAEFAGDHHLEQRMMGGVLQMLIDLTEGSFAPSGCTYWLWDHIGWGVTEQMVCDMFEAVVATIREGLGERWTPDMTSSWRDLISRLQPVLHAGFANA